jgi:hypothetical protein
VDLRRSRRFFESFVDSPSVEWIYKKDNVVIVQPAMLSARRTSSFGVAGKPFKGASYRSPERERFCNNGFFVAKS